MRASSVVGFFVCTIILQIPFVCVTGAALETPYGHLKG